MFNKGDIVKLANYAKTYEVMVTGTGYDDGCFAGVILKTDYSESDYHGVLTVGTYDNDFRYDEFKLVG